MDGFFSQHGVERRIADSSKREVIFMEGRNADSYLRFMIFVEDINANGGGIPEKKESPKDVAYFESLGLYRMHGMYGLSAR